MPSSDRPHWKPLSPRNRGILRDRIARALTPLLSGPDAERAALELVEAVADGQTRNVYRHVRHELLEEVPDVTVGVVVAEYVGSACDLADQREAEELLGDAGVPAELVSDVLEEIRSTKGRAA